MEVARQELAAGPNRQSDANRQCSTNTVNSRSSFRSSTWNECYANACQSRDSSRNAMNARSNMRINFSIFRGRYDRQRALGIRIAAITLASHSAITVARCRPSKLQRWVGGFQQPERAKFFRLALSQAPQSMVQPKQVAQSGSSPQA